MAIHSHQSHPSVLPQRSTAVLIVVCLHLGMVYLLATGLATRAVQLLVPPTQVINLPPVPAAPAPPPPRAPQLIQPKPELPVIHDIVVESDPEASPITTACQGADCTRPSVIAQPPPPVVRVPGGVGKGFPNTDDFYPPSAVRLGQEGVTAVRVCVDEKGRLASEPALAHSSSIASIDAAALRLARAGSGHYLPATENGQPVSSCYAFSIRFHLK